MSNMFWKSIPALAFALSVGAYAQVNDVALSELAVKDKVIGRSRSGAACGIVEGNQCYARACSMAGGGAFEFDFLYWRAENRGFRLGNSVRETTGPIMTAVNPIFCEDQWNPGFRLGMGWNTTHDRWDLFFNWTWYKNHANANVTAQPGWRVDSPSATFQSMNGSWKLWHNCLDMELGRAYYLTQRLSLRSHYGVRGAVLKQKASATFSGPTSAILAETDRYLQKFWGAGPRAGVQTKYHVGKGFCVVGKGSLAVLFGQEKWQAKKLGMTTALPQYNIYKAGKMLQTVVPNINLFLGIEWDTCVSCDEVFFGMQAGWEVNYWMNQYSIQLGINNVPTNGNPVTMEGLTVNFHIDF